MKQNTNTSMMPTFSWVLYSFLFSSVLANWNKMRQISLQEPKYPQSLTEHTVSEQTEVLLFTVDCFTTCLACFLNTSCHKQSRLKIDLKSGSGSLLIFLHSLKHSQNWSILGICLPNAPAGSVTLISFLPVCPPANFVYFYESVLGKRCPAASSDLMEK